MAHTTIWNYFETHTHAHTCSAFSALRNYIDLLPCNFVHLGPTLVLVHIWLSINMCWVSREINKCKCFLCWVPTFPVGEKAGLREDEEKQVESVVGRRDRQDSASCKSITKWETSYMMFRVDDKQTISCRIRKQRMS